MIEVRDTVSPRDRGSTRIDVDIEVSATDGEEALELVERIREAVKEELREGGDS